MGALIKYDSLIDAVTCKGTSSLKVLTEANCINIIEIEYDAEWIVNNNNTGPGLVELASGICLHSTREAISIKNLSYAIELFQFLDGLFKIEEESWEWQEEDQPREDA
ncbi:hypothetical protein BG006_004203 [Podila minutissima]|uniref:Uncharacterized protein n=1 Tax=Podila minutissima TaxID=64525 RepID=A0A9P5VMU6_9FUNG|nr:hypothetical protein BG006_004203 [Podila minutissima]